MMVGDIDHHLLGPACGFLSFLRELLRSAYLPVRKGSGLPGTIEIKMIDSLNIHQEFTP